MKQRRGAKGGVRTVEFMIVCGTIGLVGFIPLAGISPAVGATTKLPTDELLTVSEAVQSGFVRLVKPAQLSTNTGFTECPTVAQEAFENTAATTGLVSQTYFCQSDVAAGALMKGIRSTGSAITGVMVPARLGSSATARESNGSNFGIFWQRGRVVEVAAIDTRLSGAGTSTVKGSGQSSLTNHLRGVLVRTAKEQDARFIRPPDDPT